MERTHRTSRSPARQQEDMVVEVWHGIHTLTKRGNHLTCCYIPGHCGLEGNEKADDLAGRGRDEEATRKISMKNYLLQSEKAWTKRRPTSDAQGRRKHPRGWRDSADERKYSSTD
eukprot:TRINITY_DN3753_c1_g1_i3.p1 TRINITY_DN3753_c1_g1~~TRINITY_DN3753_c1_g1_i3.p1  ORF type:complete len:115 (+),score=19.09 TRINITY_DN3753_c1_g1_i3:55-399(+)